MNVKLQSWTQGSYTQNRRKHWLMFHRILSCIWCYSILSLITQQNWVYTYWTFRGIKLSILKPHQKNKTSIQNNIAWRNDTKNLNKEWSEVLCCSKNNYLNPQGMGNNWLGFFRKSSGITLDHKPNTTTTCCCIKSHHCSGIHYSSNMDTERGKSRMRLWNLHRKKYLKASRTLVILFLDVSATVLPA